MYAFEAVLEICILISRFLFSLQALEVSTEQRVKQQVCMALLNLGWHTEVGTEGKSWAQQTLK